MYIDLLCLCCSPIYGKRNVECIRCNSFSIVGPSLERARAYRGNMRVHSLIEFIKLFSKIATTPHSIKYITWNMNRSNAPANMKSHTRITTSQVHTEPFTGSRQSFEPNEHRVFSRFLCEHGAVPHTIQVNYQLFCKSYTCVRPRRPLPFPLCNRSNHCERPMWLGNILVSYIFSRSSRFVCYIDALRSTCTIPSLHCTRSVRKKGTEQEKKIKWNYRENWIKSGNCKLKIKAEKKQQQQRRKAKESTGNYSAVAVCSRVCTRRTCKSWLDWCTCFQFSHGWNIFANAVFCCHSSPRSISPFAAHFSALVVCYALRRCLPAMRSSKQYIDERLNNNHCFDGKGIVCEYTANWQPRQDMLLEQHETHENWLERTSDTARTFSS